MKKSIKKSLAIALAAGLGFAGIVACDPPEEAADPVAEEATEELEAPEAPEPPDQAQPGAQEGPDDMALDQPPQGMPGEGMDLDEELSDEEVDQFAEVITTLQELDEDREDPQARMEAAETPQERQEIQQELMTEMQQAIEDTGMSFHEFMMMSQRLQQDPNFQERLEERVDLSEIMQEQQDAPPPPAPH